MKKILDTINAYMNDGERWHEWGLICFYGFLILGLVGLSPQPYRVWVWLDLVAINWLRVIYQEIGIERSWKLTGLNRDFWYDSVSRPAGSALLGSLSLLPMWSWLLVIVVVLVLTYKWKWFW